MSIFVYSTLYSIYRAYKTRNKQKRVLKERACISVAVIREGRIRTMQTASPEVATLLGSGLGLSPYIAGKGGLRDG